MKAVSFRELVQAKYIDVGFSKEQALAKLYVDTGVSRSSLRAAMSGTRVSSETARDLTLWAAKTHHVDLSELELLQAPTKPMRERGDPGKRAEELVEAAVHSAGLPAELACSVTYDLSVGAWSISCISRTGGPANQQTAPELSDALRAVVDTHYGRRSA